MLKFIFLGACFAHLALAGYWDREIDKKWDGLPHYLVYSSEERDSTEEGGPAGKKSTTCPCGWANKKKYSRIVNGEYTDENEFPFMVALIEKETNWKFCGGSLISEYHAITAAHCTIDAIKENMDLAIVVGQHSTRSPIPGVTKIVDVETIRQHEDYNPNNYKNDISVLVLKTKVNITPLVGPVCMPTGQMDFKRGYVKIIGWGALYTSGPSSHILQKVDVRVVPPRECNFMYKMVDWETPTQVCTYAKDRASCQGDSGGPVVWVDPDTNRYTLIGLVSFGRQCADASPTVHTDVAYYLPWINKQIEATKKAATCRKA